MSKQIFKDIPNYNGVYQVSNLGNVKSFNKNKKGKLLKYVTNHKGYFMARLYKNKKQKGFGVHQLVAMAFLDHKPCGMELVVNHINFNKKDNRVENLEVITNRENCNSKHLKSTSKYIGVCFDKSRKKWMAYTTLNRSQISFGRFKTEYEAHLEYEKRIKTINF